MLGLTIAEGEKIHFKDSAGVEFWIVAEIASVAGRTIQVGIEAPQSISVVRGEIYDKTGEIRSRTCVGDKRIIIHECKGQPAGPMLRGYPVVEYLPRIYEYTTTGWRYIDETGYRSPRVQLAKRLAEEKWPGVTIDSIIDNEKFMSGVVG